MTGEMLLNEIELIREGLIASTHREIDRYFDALKMRLSGEELNAVISDEEAVLAPIRLDFPHYFIGTKPAKLFIGNDEYEVKSWINVVRIVLAQINENRRYELRELAGKYSGKSRIILGTKGEGMDKPIKVDDDVYFEGHFGTEAIITHLMRICKYTGFDTNEIRVTLRNK